MGHPMAVIGSGMFQITTLYPARQSKSKNILLRRLAEAAEAANIVIGTNTGLPSFGPAGPREENEKQVEESP